MGASTIILLLATGMFVGVVNTFAGGAAVVSIAVFTALGLPVNIANGTTRLPVLFQCLTTSISFARKGVLDFRRSFRLSIPTVIGAIIGAQFASLVSNSVMTIMLSAVMVLLLLTLIFNPTKLLRENPELTHRPTKATDYLLFFIIGLYGGCFHIGIGFIILYIATVSMGYNLMQANAIKSFVVLMYVPFSLTIFIMNGQVDIVYGLIHGAGNIVGASLAVRYSDHIGLKLLRWALVVVTVITLMDLLKIISLKATLETLLEKL